MRKIQFTAWTILLIVTLTACGIDVSQLVPSIPTETANTEDGSLELPAAEELGAAPTADSVEMTLEESQRDLRFIAIQHGRCEPDALLWCEFEESMTDAAEQLGVALDIRSTETFSIDEMIQLINQAIDEKPDGIAVTISDPARLQDPLQRVADAQIPLVAYGFGTNPDADNIPYITYFGPDNYLAGLNVGNKLRRNSLDRLELAVCVLPDGFTYWQESRCAGMADALEPYSIETEIVLDGLGGSKFGVRTLEEFFETQDDFEFVAVATTNPMSTEVFYEQVKDLSQGDREDLIHVAFELNSRVKTAIREEETDFSLNSEYYSEGFGTVRTLMLAARYGIKSPLDQVPREFSIVSIENVDDVEFQVDRNPDRPLKIIVVQHALCVWDDFWCVVENGLADAAKDLAIDLEIRGIPEVSGGDHAVGAQLIREAASENPDGLIVTIPDRDVYREPLADVIESGIPVIAINSGAGPELDGIPYLSLIAQDEYLAGAEAASMLVQKSASFDNRAVCINHVPGLFSGDSRCLGFVDQMTRSGIPVEVLDLSPEYNDAKAQIDQYILDNPSTNIFLTLGPTGAHPFYDCLAESGDRQVDIVHGTFDLSPQITANILDGLTQFSIDQQPFLQGYLSLEAFHLFLRYGVEPPLDIYPTGPGFVDQSNIDVFANLSGVYR